MKFCRALGALALVSNSLAQNVTYCPGGNVCFSVNVPVTSASSGSGNIYFQITGPTTMSWIGIGQGSSMTNANIFMVYADSAGTNVTLSPRLGTGNKAPASDTTAQATLLSGSGISNGLMTANVRCSNCNSWPGGSMNFTDSSSDWIWAYKTGSAVSSDSLSVSLSQHNKYGSTALNLQNAAGGSSSNPFATTIATTTSSGSTSSSSGGGSSSPPKDFPRVRMAHAILAPLAFVLFFPSGAIAIRILSFRNLVWFHAGWMVFTYIMVLGSMGMGVWIAVLTDQLDTTHSVIGLVVVGSLLLQPISGLAHHMLYKKKGRPNAATYPHIWWGRAIITLGIINGGLGLELSSNTTKGAIAYVVIAGFMWLLWMGVIVLAFMKSQNKREGETGGTVFETKSRNTRLSIEDIRPIQQASPLRQSYSDGEFAIGNTNTSGARPTYRF